MKKYILMAAFAALALVGCQSGSSDESYLSSLTITLAAPTGDFAGESLAGTTVTLVNTSDQSTQTTQADAAGVATFADITAGTYNVTAMIKVSGSYVLTATQSDVIVGRSVEKSVDLSLLAVASSDDLIIKQIYYGGHPDWSILMKDAFIELYNNTDKVIYADGIYLGETASQNTGDDDTDPVMYGTGMVDGTGVEQLPLGEYIYLMRIAQLPGSGEEYPVQPGESVVIAMNANDWTTAYNPDNAQGLTAESYVDLSNATFEMSSESFLADLGFTHNSYFDTDNVAIPNIIIKYMSSVMNSAFYQMSSSGPGMVIFRQEAALDITDVVVDPTSTSADDASKQRFVRVKADNVIDGVDCLYGSGAAKYRRLPNTIDAGFTYLDPAGSVMYKAKSVRRKVVEEVGGRKVLKDTNNSTEDFEQLDYATPFGF